MDQLTMVTKANVTDNEQLHHGGNMRQHQHQDHTMDVVYHEAAGG